MNWTKELPTENGFYWYRDGSLITKISVVEFIIDGDYTRIEFTGSDFNGYFKPEDCAPEGEFWPQRLTPPTT